MGMVAYTTSGDPSLAATLKFVDRNGRAGADVIELGVSVRPAGRWAGLSTRFGASRKNGSKRSPR